MYQNKHQMWCRLCPSCKKEISYNNIRPHKAKWQCKNAEIINKLCKSCKQMGKKNCNYGKSTWIKGKQHSKETRNKISFSLIGGSSWNKGQPHRPDHKRKLRVAAAKRIQKLGVVEFGPNYNPLACKFIDKLNLEKGWNLLHAMNGGEFYIEELGHWMDGYDKGNNIIFEYDESDHERPSKKQRDLIRQNEIINHLKPSEFWRYNERHNELRRIV